MSDFLQEGMRGGDLEDMVLPLISVDEYESKVDKNAIVFAFYVNDIEAAMDMNRFIQKSPAMILSTEVSPAPDQNGFYMVFFEFLKNDRLAQNVREVLDEIEPLTNNAGWQLRIRGVDRLVPFSVAALKAQMDKEPAEPKEKTIEEQVLTFLQPSSLSGTSATDKQLVIEGMGGRVKFEIVDFGPTDELLEKHDFGALGMSMSDAAYELRLALMLGDGWSVHRVGGTSILLHEWSEQALILK